MCSPVFKKLFNVMYSFVVVVVVNPNNGVSDKGRTIEMLYQFSVQDLILMGTTSPVYAYASVKIRCNFYHCIKLYTCISYIVCFKTLISFAGDSLKLCLHVPEIFLAIPLTEILHWHDKWSKNRQKIALCCNISKMMFFQLEVSLYSNFSQLKIIFYVMRNFLPIVLQVV